MTIELDENAAAKWVDGYVQAWRSENPKDLDAIFAVDAESYEWPYETEWIGLPAIKEGWSARRKWQEGGWTFDWHLAAISGDTFAVSGVGHYTELGSFSNLWVVTLNAVGTCTVFRMWNNEIPAAASGVLQPAQW